MTVDIPLFGNRDTKFTTAQRELMRSARPLSTELQLLMDEPGRNRSATTLCRHMAMTDFKATLVEMSLCVRMIFAFLNSRSTGSSSQMSRSLGMIEIPKMQTN